MRQIAVLFSKLLPALLALALLPVSCIEEDLPSCRLYLAFTYDYNMLYADAFHTQVDKVDLYVFDEAGRFLFQQSDEGAALATGDYRMALAIRPGDYKVMAWGGARDSYNRPEMVAGQSTLTDMELFVKREASRVIDKELEPLWYGEIRDIHFTGKAHQTDTVNLIKDTNKVRFVFNGVTPEWKINVADYTYELIESNGYLNYDNTLREDETLSYRPYFMEAIDNGGMVELNTLRLMADRKTRFIVTHKNTGKVVFDINLTQFLLWTAMEQPRMGKQEYLDREDEYKIVFLFGGNTPDPGPGPDPGEGGEWLAVQININGWTWYIQEENPGL
ncbi:hypothetical protein M2480_002187 [Parabacteroides sp. PFB2-12]|uniref:FimB/Mfa2 family fimbrial subunit n=1 Tax=unclassified Parabacteroides TaxID=2649774 RepID=UPI002474071B|nr:MULTISPECIES: FimB/Mfa2 family fimbrial subunit [unclassified Parabacteroides]MDH6343834.1 hypothetical protein [Parabacteroides sp. PM6-13]MDH6391196.1 hypothetical protein [Parabacteroides sp. PFB2-12]